MQVQELEEAGYRRCVDGAKSASLKDWYVISYQKRITDAHGTRYFITVCHGRYPKDMHNGADFFSADARLTVKGDDHLDVERACTALSVQEIEKMYDQIWDLLDLTYDPHNQEY